MNTLLTQNIFTLLGLDDMPDDRKATMPETMTELVQKRLALRLLDALSEADATALEALLEDHRMDDPAVVQFFQKRVPNIAEILQEEVAGLKEELVQTVAA